MRQRLCDVCMRRESTNIWQVGGFSEDQLRELRQAFSAYDANADGQVDVNELGDILRRRCVAGDRE